MRSLALIATIWCVAASAMAQEALPSIDSALVKKIEENMVLPVGASLLAEYSRFYAVDEVAGRAVVRGVYLKSSASHYIERASPVEGVADAYVLKAGVRLPVIADGGCGVIETTFDLSLQSLWIHRFAGRPAPEGDEATAYCHGR